MSIVWDSYATRPELSGVTENLTADLIVVGLGGSGLTAVNQACELGLNVIGVDAGPIAAGAGGRNGGFFLAGIASFHHDAIAQHGHARAKALYEHTLAEMKLIESVTPEAVKRTGVLRKAADDAEFDDCIAHRDALVADGFAGELFENEQGRGLLIPTDGVFNPVTRTVALAHRAVNLGARLFVHSPVTRVESGVVHVGDYTLTAPHILVAVDGKLERVLPELEGRVRTTRLQMAATGPGNNITLQYPVYSRHGYDYWQQLEDGAIALGGGRDKAMDTEWTSNDEPSELIQDYITETLRLIGATAPIVHRWAASVSYTDTGLPLIEEVHHNVWAIGGYCGTGNVVGALLGRAIVNQFAGQPAEPLKDFISS